MAFWATWGLLWAQVPYFQQRVEYRIQVRLEPQTHTLHGYLRLRYTNNSPDVLPGLYFHLWPNAYQNRRTAFARQERITGNSRFYFAKASERGRIDSLDFRVNGQPVKPLPATQGPPPASGYSRELLKHAPDVVWLPLPAPLQPGQTVEIETPFRVQVPLTFSRLGHQGPSYQISQWYPKPAVYDRKGWHPLPYLDQGEFYSEWGRYEVEISVPENYIVGATGRLLDQAEHARLRQREAETRAWLATLPQEPSPASLSSRVRVQISGRDTSFFPSTSLPAWARSQKPASTYKTLHFEQDSVHDFAWFADPRYGVLSDTTTLYNGHRVACVALFYLKDARAWQHAPQYIKYTLDSLSRAVGPYPYDHATAVEGALSAGGGMEYPMITVITPMSDTTSLKNVIIHEVGHNWFQGLLASNERLHPWQDEGLNSYYENRLMGKSFGLAQENADSAQRKSPGRVILDFGGVSLPVRAGKVALIGNPLLAFYHHLNADQPLALSSERYSLLSYALGVYQRTAAVVGYFASVVGQDRFDAAMQGYFRRWAFRHPYPEDWAASLEAAHLPGQSLLRTLNSDQEPDFRLKVRHLNGLTYQVHLMEQPDSLWKGLPLSAIAIDRAGRVLQRYTLELDSTHTLTLPEGTYLFVLNPEQALFERHVDNNFFYTRGLLRTWPRPFFHVAPLTLPQIGRLEVGLQPAAGYNYRDGLLVGLLINHGLFPKRRVEFHLLPMYSLLRSDLRGSAGLTLRAFPSAPLQLIETRLRTAQFAGFWRTKAAIEGTFRRRYEVFGWRHTVRLRGYFLAYQDLERRAYRWENSGRPAYLAADWEARREEAILTLYTSISVGHDLQGHLRAEAEGRLSWKAAPKYRPWLRTYAGWVAAGAPAYLVFRAAGYDPFGEQVLIDRFREGPTRLTRQQLPETQGAWRTPTDTLQTRALVAGNLELPLPGLPQLVLRADAGYLPLEKRTYWGLSLGLPVVRFRDRFLLGGYFPVLGDAFAGGKPSSFQAILQSFTWHLNLPLDLRWGVPW
ncbi:MAG: M1 family peptidase [Bacteroidetes bacterium]|nr:MAG: M1 family peptidase [Bacteroidota bacterium]